MWRRRGGSNTLCKRLIEHESEFARSERMTEGQRCLDTVVQISMRSSCNKDGRIVSAHTAASSAMCSPQQA